MSNEKKVQALISKTLYYGVWASAAVLLAGLAVARFNPALGDRILIAGLLLLLLTPIARVIMLAAGYLRAGQPKFAAMSAVILVTMLIGYLFGK